MSSETEKNVSETVENNVAAPKSKLPMLIGLLVVGVAAVYGGRMLLDAQVPKGENEFVREASEVPASMQMNPSVGFKPGGNTTSAATDTSKSDEEKEEAEEEKKEE
jgi:hypothetical protein